MARRYDEYVRESEAARLPHRLRLAWAASVYQTVLELYSPYFRQRFRQQEALDVAWEYAVNGQADEPQLRDLLDRIADLIPDSENEDYGRNALAPGMLLLTDIASGRPRDSVAVVDNAAVMFAAHHLFRQGIGGFDPSVSQEYEMQLEMPIYLFARAVFDTAVHLSNEPIRRGMFDGCRVDTSGLRRLGSTEAKPRSVPPPREVEFIQQNGWR